MKFSIVFLGDSDNEVFLPGASNRPPPDFSDTLRLSGTSSN